MGCPRRLTWVNQRPARACQAEFMKAEAIPSFALHIIREEHRALAAVLRSLAIMIDRPPEEKAERFFGTLRAMLFYIDEFPERLHHRNESTLFFPKMVQRSPDLLPVIQRLESDHESGERRVRELQHLLLAWELIGDSRREAFVSAVQAYVHFYLEHMRIEEAQLHPVAARVLTAEDWTQLNTAFEASRDPLAGGPRDPTYERLFTRIVVTAPAPIGVGEP